MTQDRKLVRSYNTPSDAHELTFSAFHGLKLLDRDRSCRWFIDALESTRTKHKLHLWAYVIMPDHVHVLFWPTADYEIRAIRSSLKLPVTRQAIKYLTKSAPTYLEKLKDLQPNGKVAYRFWQRGGGYDRNVIEIGTLEKMIEYIHNNPVRRGLVEKPTDWVWSSARFHAGYADVPIRMDPLPILYR